MTMYLTPGAVAHQAHAVVDDRDHRAAEDGVEDPALAAEQAGAADDGRADRVEQHVAAAGVRVDRAGPGGGDDAADGRHRRSRSRRR